MSEETTFSFPPRGHVAILAYDSANDRWQAVYVDSSGNLQVDVASGNQIEALAHGYSGSAWQKLGFIWSYYDRWAERVTDADAEAGNNTLESAAVPAGYVYVVQAVSAQDNTSGPTDIMVYCYSGSVAPKLVYQAAPGVAVPVVWVGAAALKEGDTIRALFRGCTAGDDIYLEIWGYKMKIDM